VPTAYDLARADLERSDIAIAQAEAAEMFTVENAAAIYEDFRPLPALVIPYVAADGSPKEFERAGERLDFCRVRYLGELPPLRGRRKTLRYAQPAKSGVHAYFPRVEAFQWKNVIEDVEVPLLITEGEKKALRACLAGIPTIGLGGVFNFMDGDKLLPDLEQFRLKGRTVYICFDSDAEQNVNIQTAEGRLSTELSQVRKADVFLARLPKLKGQDKTGLDDFIASEGEDAIYEVLQKAPQLRKIDAAVLGMSQTVAYVEREGSLIDTETQIWMDKSNFVNGSKYSSLHVLTPKMDGSGVKRTYIAPEFLKHPLARRVSDITFDPSTDEQTLETERGVAFNIWTGFETSQGDVTPFLDLSDHIFSDLPEDFRDFALKLMIYKAQNPASKVPIAVVLTSDQGSGKSMWCRILRKAFGKYGKVVDPSALTSAFNPWIEGALLAIVDEAKQLDVYRAQEKLKSYISEETAYCNAKYRTEKQIRNYAQFILTANDRGVGAFAGDDRRMFVCECPPAREHSFYLDYVLPWENAGGPQRLMNWMLEYDLQGWKPPSRPPMTTEKIMARLENLDPVERIAEDIKNGTQNVVLRWLDSANEWCRANAGNEKMAAYITQTQTALATFQVRPWYTSEELAVIFPHIAETMHSDRRAKGTPAGQLSKKLRENGVRFLKPADDPRGFLWKGTYRLYLVIADVDDWREPVTQDYFEHCMSNFPYYEQFQKRTKSKLS